ncbi:hypothetical protein ACQUFY_23280 [Robbsia andropogonis]|uniref:hypothetical protein n=1 Tax=Robbsia andropogonis TaxID=28092 RepID=UPI003D25B44D
MTNSNARSGMEDDRFPLAPMSLARFEALTDAYGGCASRWSAAERGAAQRLLDGTGSDADGARSALASASALDALLARDTVPAITAQEVQDVLATFASGPLRHWTLAEGWRRARVAVMAGLVAFVGVAGVASGAMLTSIWFPANAATLTTLDGLGMQNAAEPLYRGTVFGGSVTDWSEQ